MPTTPQQLAQRLSEGVIADMLAGNQPNDAVIVNYDGGEQVAVRRVPLADGRYDLYVVVPEYSGLPLVDGLHEAFKQRPDNRIHILHTSENDLGGIDCGDTVTIS